MNLQERLEALLDERRVHVNVDPENGSDYRTKLLHEELGDWLIEACGGDGIGTPEAMHDRDNWLVRVAGAALYLMHPEDEAKVAAEAALETHDTQWVFVGAVRASAVYVCGLFWSNGQPCDQVISVPSGNRVGPATHAYHNPDPAPGLAGTHTHRGVDGRVTQLNPDHTVLRQAWTGEHDVPLVVKRGDGTYKRKPRPDVG